MDLVIGFILWAIIIYNWRLVFKLCGFFAVGFFLGLKGFNPANWFDND